MTAKSCESSCPACLAAYDPAVNACDDSVFRQPESHPEGAMGCRSQIQEDKTGSQACARAGNAPIETASASSFDFPWFQPASFECQTRHNFRNADMSGVFQHPQYRCPRTDRPPHHGEVARHEAIELDDSRLVSRYPTAFPASPTNDMLKTFPHLIRNEPTKSPGLSMKRRLSQSTLGLSAATMGHSLESTSGNRNVGHPAQTAGGDAEVKDWDVTKEEAHWATVMRTADTTGLVPPPEEEQAHITYVCSMRKQTPFAFKGGQVTLKPSHRFTSLLAHAAPAPMPRSTMQEALEESVQPRVQDLFRDNPPASRNWTQTLSADWHDSDMFAVLTHPSAVNGTLAKRNDRKLHDGMAAKSRAPELAESGKPLVHDPSPEKTRAALHRASLKKQAGGEGRPGRGE